MCKKFLDAINIAKQKRIGRARHAALLLFFIAVTLVPVFISPVLYVVSFVSFICVIVLKIKRIHDFNYSAFWLLISFVPLFNFIFLLMTFFNGGTKGANRFGPEPPKPSRIELYIILVSISIIAIVFGSKVFFLISLLKA